jgi:hypothetical protein
MKLPRGIEETSRLVHLGALDWYPILRELTELAAIATSTSGATLTSSEAHG